MAQRLVVVENPKRWPLQIPDVRVVAARDYLTKPEFIDLRRAHVFNLCRGYGYQSTGYYVSLLATARGHRPLPSVTTLQDLRQSAILRVVSEDLEASIQNALAPLKSDTFRISIYFGRNLARRYDRLSQALFNHFPAPMLRAEFVRERETWRLQSLRPIASSEVPESHHDFLIGRARRFFDRPRVGARRTYRYEMAILTNPSEIDAPSNERAISRFIRAAARLGINAETVTRDDIGRVAEYDALFIRETTSVTHHTYRFASRAAAAGLVVIDDPESIVRCTNKVYQAELFQRLGIRTPKTMVVSRENTRDVGAALGYPVVLKQPDSSFSLGVRKAESPEELKSQLEALLDRSELVVAQEYAPSGFDWRIGVLGGKPLYVSKYHMARGHWQIQKSEDDGTRRYGKVETLAVEDTPAGAVELGVHTASTVGDGLYGVDVKEVNGTFVVMEVNDNPNIEAGYEDAVLKEDLYRAVMQWFLDRLERRGQTSVGMNRRRLLHLFEGFGVELEYAIVDAETLDIRPLAAELLDAAGGNGQSEIELGPISWSNELVLHVIEFKTAGPASNLIELGSLFHEHVTRANGLLEPMGARLMPTGMHPWMDPDREMALWPHEAGEIYQAYHRIFNCRGHGWSNLQSAHLNLPFADDAEFERLHAAIRLVLPLVPGIAASTPVVDGGLTGRLDTRLDVYRHNSDRIRSIAGRVIPEQVFSRTQYEGRLLRQLYDDISPHDPDNVLQHEWLNSRGCIARFERSAIEIRLLDLQECPQADLAVIWTITEVVHALVDGRLGDLERQKSFHEDPLADLLLEGIGLAENAVVSDPEYLSVLGYTGAEATCGDIWRHLADVVRSRPGYDVFAESLGVILDHGSLASRIARALGPSPDRQALHRVYARLCEALTRNEMFGP